MNESILTAADHERSVHSKSIPIEHQSASSDEDEEQNTNPEINILPPIENERGHSHKRISFVNNVDETAFHTHESGNIVCTVTPGLGVFLTTSSRHTPHSFERVLARIHAVC